MGTGLLLAAMLLFVTWACAHTERRAGWHQDEVESERFLAELRADDSPPLIIESSWDAAVAGAFHAAVAAFAEVYTITDRLVTRLPADDPIDVAQAWRAELDHAARQS